MPELVRIASRLTCVAAVVFALVVMIEREPAATIHSRPARVAVVPTRAADAWAVQVDGWHIVVDGVVVGRSSRASVRPAVMKSGRDEFKGFGPLIGKHAEVEGLDWRLVAAVAFEESRFDPHAVSPAGAFGLMQVREIAARDVGLKSYLAPDANVRAGVRYLRAMADTFAAAHGRDRHALMLAAYNMGPGHVFDAQTLARELGFAPTVWDGAMEKMVRLLEQPAFFTRLPSGYAQGKRVVAYVERVLARYGEYRRRYPSEPLALVAR